ncbi:hypothetical protein ACT4R9_11020 [Ornithobacterium rhinotracheale]
MKLSYELKEIEGFYHYYYEWIDYLDAVVDPKKIINEYPKIEDSLKK